MAIDYVYKIDKGYEKQVLNKFFHDSKLHNCTMVGDSSGAMQAREYVSKGQARVKILEFKRATYIKTESVLNHTNIMKVRNVGD
jgi:predicted patatin/cPLA2 family phospholipase